MSEREKIYRLPMPNSDNQVRFVTEKSLGSFVTYRAKVEKEVAVSEENIARQITKDKGLTSLSQ